jgi:hypothetical protein
MQRHRIRVLVEAPNSAGLSHHISARRDRADPASFHNPVPPKRNMHRLPTGIGPFALDPSLSLH